jgi:hypothetical protein
MSPSFFFVLEADASLQQSYVYGAVGYHMLPPLSHTLIRLSYTLKLIIIT